jgi:hypothetical protein
MPRGTLPTAHHGLGFPTPRPRGLRAGLSLGCRGCAAAPAARPCPSGWSQEGIRSRWPTRAARTRSRLMCCPRRARGHSSGGRGGRRRREPLDSLEPSSAGRATDRRCTGRHGRHQHVPRRGTAGSRPSTPVRSRALGVTEQLGRPITKAWKASGSTRSRPRAGRRGARIAIPVATDRDRGRRVAMALVEDTGLDASLRRDVRQQPDASCYRTDSPRQEMPAALSGCRETVQAARPDRRCDPGKGRGRHDQSDTGVRRPPESVPVHLNPRSMPRTCTSAVEQYALGQASGRSGSQEGGQRGQVDAPAPP